MITKENIRVGRMAIPNGIELRASVRCELATGVVREPNETEADFLHRVNVAEDAVKVAAIRSINERTADRVLKIEAALAFASAQHETTGRLDLAACMRDLRALRHELQGDT